MQHFTVEVVRLRYHPALRLVGTAVARPVVFLIKQEPWRDKGFKLFQAFLQDVAVFNVEHGHSVAQVGVAAEEAVDVLDAGADEHQLFLVESYRVMSHLKSSNLLSCMLPTTFFPYWSIQL